MYPCLLLSSLETTRPAIFITGKLHKVQKALFWFSRFLAWHYPFTDRVEMWHSDVHMANFSSINSFADFQQSA